MAAMVRKSGFALTRRADAKAQPTEATCATVACAIVGRPTSADLVTSRHAKTPFSVVKLDRAVGTTPLISPAAVVVVAITAPSGLSVLARPRAGPTDAADAKSVIATRLDP